MKKTREHRGVSYTVEVTKSGVDSFSEARFLGNVYFINLYIPLEETRTYKMHDLERGLVKVDQIAKQVIDKNIEDAQIFKKMGFYHEEKHNERNI